MSLCKNCITVFHYEGTPEGKFDEIGGVRCYVGTPTKEYAKDKVVLLLPGVFGIDLINVQLLVDDFARCGFKTVAVDYLLGDTITDEDLKSPNFNSKLKEWHERHGPERTRPEIDHVIAALKEHGVCHFAATGYCFGGRYSFDLAFENIIEVTVVSHPSFLRIPDDFKTYKSKSKAPLLINAGELDTLFPPEAQAIADQILGGGNQFTDTYRREYFANCAHGFAVHGDLSNPVVKEAKEGAFRAAVVFLEQHL